MEPRGQAATAGTADPAAVHRRTVVTLVCVQVVGGIGIGSALAVGGLIAEELTGSQTWAGMATTMVTLGAAVFALPLAAVTNSRGRRPGLGLGWVLATVGALLAIVGADRGSFGGFLVGMVLFGAGTAANLQSRYAAVDLSADHRRGRDLSLVVWATTIGSVAGPNLTGPGAVVARSMGLMPLLGPLVFSTASFAVAGVLTFVLLRPDPLVTARALAAPAGTPGSPAPAGTPAPKKGIGASLRAIARSPMAVLAVVGIVASHAVMIAVMTMTPVHLAHGGASLTVIGVTISLHIAGMYAFSPLVGWAADRFGRVNVLLAGQAVLIASAVVSALAGNDALLVTVGLVLLGLGWSFGLVAASALLSESLEVAERPGAQGVSDLLMSLGGAVCGAASGLLLALLGFAALNGVAILPTLLVGATAVWALQRRRPASDAATGT